MPDGPRVIVVGVSGSGKTTVARRAASRLGVPHVELDAIRHGPNWTETPDDEFRHIVAGIAAQDGWVVDGNYRVVRDLLHARAATVVWLDPPKSAVMAQVIWRSVARAVTQRELWNGNRERARDWIRPDHPIRWAWATYAARKAQYYVAMDTRWVRLRSRREVNAWLESLLPTGRG